MELQFLRLPDLAEIQPLLAQEVVTGRVTLDVLRIAVINVLFQMLMVAFMVVVEVEFQVVEVVQTLIPKLQAVL